MSSKEAIATLSSRVIMAEESIQLRSICEQHSLALGVFTGIIVQDILKDPAKVAHYVKLAQQFEEDQKPASIEELKQLRQKLREQEEELQQLRRMRLEDAQVKNASYGLSPLNTLT